MCYCSLSQDTLEIVNLYILFILLSVVLLQPTSVFNDTYHDEKLNDSSNNITVLFVVIKELLV